MIKAIIGLGNPGPQFLNTRHNIGFAVLDALADQYGASWRQINNMLLAEVDVDGNPVLLIKPQTFMNHSGQVAPFLNKKGINPEEILVVHDEIELPFGKVTLKSGGSARGHNGLRSLIATMGDAFKRIRIGVDRPAAREQVPDYVLERFKESPEQVQHTIDKAIQLIKEQIKKP